MSNTKLYDQLSPCPEDATKPFNRGWSGKSIDPQWRIKTLTEAFGPCGIGWGFDITNRWSDEAEGHKFAFVSGRIWYVWEGEKRYSLETTGGTQFSSRQGEDAYKCSETDALGKSAVAIGLAADVYHGKHDGDKYQIPASQAPIAKSPAERAMAATPQNVDLSGDLGDQLGDANRINGQYRPEQCFIGWTPYGMMEFEEKKGKRIGELDTPSLIQIFKQYPKKKPDDLSEQRKLGYWQDVYHTLKNRGVNVTVNGGDAVEAGAAEGVVTAESTEDVPF